MTKYTIVVLKEGKPPEAFRDLRFYCKVSGLSYSTISKKKLPFEYNGKTIYRCLLMPEIREEGKKGRREVVNKKFILPSQTPGYRS